MTFYSDGGEWQDPNGQTLKIVAEKEADNPTGDNDLPVLKGPFDAQTLKDELVKLKDKGLISEEEAGAASLVWMAAKLKSKRRRKKRKSTKKKKNLEEKQKKNLEGDDEKKKIQMNICKINLIF